MNPNIIVFFLGCLIVTVSLLFNIYYNKNRAYENYLSNINQFSKSINTNGKDSMEIEKLKNEVTSIKKELLTVLEILNTSFNITEITDGEIDNFDKNRSKESFSNILNYSKFMNKNKDIIERYKENMSIETIAKELNKSKSEVEMVIKLIK